MSKAELSAAVVGVGMIGSLHARAYAANPHTRLVAVVDVDVDRAQAVAAELGVAAATDVDDLLAHYSPDVVSVAVPEQHRYAPAVAAAKAGVHLLLEKPLAPTLEEVDRLIDDLEPAGVTTMANFILRSDPRYLQVRDAVQQGRLGEPCTVFARRRGTAQGAELYGPWTDLLISTAIHDLDVMTWILGAPVQRVYAEAVVKRCGKWGHEDAVMATLRFANGTIGSLDTSWVLPASPEPLSAAFHLVGTGGGAWIDGSNNGLSMLDDDGYRLPDLVHWPLGRAGVEGDLRASIDHFVDCVRTGTTPVMGLADARRAQGIVAALKESIRTQRPIDLPVTG